MRQKLIVYYKIISTICVNSPRIIIMKLEKILDVFPKRFYYTLSFSIQLTNPNNLTIILLLQWD
jgi:hypothetical protein